MDFPLSIYFSLLTATKFYDCRCVQVGVYIRPIRFATSSNPELTAVHFGNSEGIRQLSKRVSGGVLERALKSYALKGCEPAVSFTHLFIETRARHNSSHSSESFGKAARKAGSIAMDA